MGAILLSGHRVQSQEDSSIDQPAQAPYSFALMASGGLADSSSSCDLRLAAEDEREMEKWLTAMRTVTQNVDQVIN